MGMKKYRFVGLNKDVWLPDNIKVEIDIVPSSRRNVRSNQIFSGQTSYTQHETANFNRGAGARMHRNWLHGGASGSSVGFNFVVDDGVIIQLTPLNEVTWAAGTPDGNRYSYHTELCVNSGINHTIARRNAAALAGGILAAKGWGTDRLYQHNRWWGKDCPYLLRRNGLWAPWVKQVDSFRKQSLAAAGGNPGTPSPAPEPSSGHGIPGFDGNKNVVVKGTTYYADKRTIEITESTNERKYADTYHPVMRTLPAGSRINVLGYVKGEAVDGNSKWWITENGRLWSGTTKEVAVPEPPKPDPPVTIVAGKNVYNNRIFYSTSDVENGREVTVADVGNIHQYADTSSKVIRKAAKGEKLVARLWCLGDAVNGEGVWWIVGTGKEANPFEECHRIPVAFTEERPE